LPLKSAGLKSVSDMPEYLLDACAVIAFFDFEEGWDVVKGLFDRAERGEIRLSMNIVNAVEVYYDRIREVGAEYTGEVFRRVYALPITVIDPMGAGIAEEAARLKAAGAISLADAFCAATAAYTGATLVTSDWGELEPIAEQGNIPFLWLRPKPKKS